MRKQTSVGKVFSELRKQGILAHMSGDPNELYAKIEDSPKYKGFVTIQKDKKALLKQMNLLCLTFAGKNQFVHDEVRKQIVETLQANGYIANLMVSPNCLQCENFKFEIFATNDPRAIEMNKVAEQRMMAIKNVIEHMGNLLQEDEDEQPCVPVKDEGRPERKEPIGDKDIDELRKLLESDVGFDTFIKLT